MQRKESSIGIKKTMNEFEELTDRIIDKEKAKYIYKMRMEKDFSWGALAQHCFHKWKNELSEKDLELWYPESNQLMGMALCRTASNILGMEVD